jgi:hypothetical protein
MKLNINSQVGTKDDSSNTVEANHVSHTCTKPLVGSSAFGLLFDVPKISHETCLNCEHRERHQCGGSIIQYCGVRKSNRTYNGQLKIKCKTPACSSFKKVTK